MHLQSQYVQLFLLNKYIETGPELQIIFWNVLLRNLWLPIALCGNMKQAPKKEDRNALRFHWLKGRRTNQLELWHFERNFTKNHISQVLEYHGKLRNTKYISFFNQRFGSKKDHVIHLWKVQNKNFSVIS